MKKMVIAGPCKTKIIDVPMPECGDDQVLVKLKYHGVCMSEHYAWQTARDGNGVDKFGFGHEPVGVAEKVGKNVTHIKEGDRVTGFFGGIAEYAVSEKDIIWKIPDNVSDEDATGEPLACLLSAVSKVPMNFPGEASVAVVGCGYMGCGAISLLKLRGAGKVVAVDIRRESLENALKYGADEAYLVDELPAKYKAFYGGDTTGFDYVMEWGETDDSLNTAIIMTKPCGFLGIGAYHTGEFRKVNMQLANLKAIDMLSTHPRQADLSKKGCERALALLSSGQWNYKDLPVKIYAMDQFDEAHEKIEEKFGKYMKALIDCQRLGGEPVYKNVD